jgi:hypothetical protein
MALKTKFAQAAPEQGEAISRVDVTKIDELKNGFSGTVLLPSDEGYDEAREIWNRMINERPATTARYAGTQDVIKALGFARDNGVPLAVRGGGHHIAGNSLVDEGIVIDLSRMRAVKVEPDAKRATVEGGATLADLDAATQAYGLATPVGINSTTGIAGLTLRRFELSAADALEAVPSSPRTPTPRRSPR